MRPTLLDTSPLDLTAAEAKAGNKVPANKSPRGSGLSITRSSFRSTMRTSRCPPSARATFSRKSSFGDHLAALEARDVRLLRTASAAKLDLTHLLFLTKAPSPFVRAVAVELSPELGILRALLSDELVEAAPDVRVFFFAMSLRWPLRASSRDLSEPQARRLHVSPVSLLASFFAAWSNTISPPITTT